MPKTYGFIVSNNSGQSFKRQYNSQKTTITGTLPFKLKTLCIAQVHLDFKPANDYVMYATKVHGFNYTEITEEQVKEGGFITKMINLIFSKKAAND